MAKGNKRKPDLRKIRTTKVYLTQEIAAELGRNLRTVNSWIKKGLPILSISGPILIDGAVLKDWLKTQHASKKQKCLPNEFFCLKCRKPRTAKFGSISFHAQNAMTLKIKALCSRCATRLNKAAAYANLAEVQLNFQQIKPEAEHLTGCDDTALNKHYFDHVSRVPVLPGGGGQKSPENNSKTGGKLH